MYAEHQAQALAKVEALKGRAKAIINEALGLDDEQMQVAGEKSVDGVEVERLRHMGAALVRGEEELRASVLESAHDEEEREEALEALRYATEAQQVAIRTYLRSIYEADKELVTCLKEAQGQLTRMNQALERPVDIYEALRYAHRLRPVTSAPKAWQPGLRLDFLPPNPYMPVNECIAASQLRQHHLDVQRANRERQSKRKSGVAGKAASSPQEPTAPAVAPTDPAAAEGEGAGGGDLSLELVKHLSESGGLGAPPPGWKPGQSLNLDANVLKRLKDEMSKAEEAAKRAKHAKGGEEGGGSGKAAPPPSSAPARPPAARPKKQTFMDESDEEDDEDEDEA